MDYKSPLSEDEFHKPTTALPVLSKLDKSDKKTLDLLLRGSAFISAKNYKQTSLSAFVSPPSKKVSDVEKKVELCQNSPENVKKIKRGTSTARKSYKNSAGDNSLKLTDMTWLRKANPLHDKTLEKKTKESVSNTFVKYGMHVQSFEDIIREMKSFTNYKKCLENLTPIDTSLCLPQITDDESECKENTLDCKYMTKKEIKSAFHQHFDYLQEICSEQRYSERHNIYVRHRNRSELNFSTSMIVFTAEQKQVLAKLLYKKFGNSSLDAHYYFKVLLPEICLKIFMEEHNMSYTEASNYLKQRPVDA